MGPEQGGKQTPASKEASITILCTDLYLRLIITHSVAVYYSTTEDGGGEVTIGTETQKSQTAMGSGESSNYQPLTTGTMQEGHVNKEVKKKKKSCPTLPSPSDDQDDEAIYEVI